MNLLDIHTRNTNNILFLGMLQVKAAEPGINIDIPLNPNNAISIFRCKRVLQALPTRAHIEFVLKDKKSRYSKVYMQNKNAKKILDQMLIRTAVLSSSKSLHHSL